MHAPSLRSLLLLLTLAALAGACTSPPPASDAGIEIPDTGASGNDAGSLVDAASAPDAGDGLCADLSELLFGSPPLPASCLPRCTSATQAAVTACGTDTTCVDAALDADATPGVMYRTRYGIYSVTCGAHRTYPCPTWERYSCYEQYCRAAFYTYSGCVDGGGACDAEFAPLQACMDASADATACLHDRVASCFP